MADREIICAVAAVIGEIIKKIQRRKKRKTKKMWVRKWIARRSALGASERLLNELAVEDRRSFLNFLRINEEMFNTLLNKVSISTLFIDKVSNIICIFQPCLSKDGPTPIQF